MQHFKTIIVFYIQNLVLIIICIGSVFSLIFHVGVKEKDIEQRFNDSSITNSSGCSSDLDCPSLTNNSNNHCDIDQSPVGEKTPLILKSNMFVIVSLGYISYLENYIMQGERTIA